MSFTYRDISQVDVSLVPDMTQVRDLGDGTHYWHEGRLTHLYVGTDVNSNLIPSATATYDLGDGTYYWHSAYFTHLYVDTDVNSNLIPDGDSTRDLGSSGPNYWHNCYFDHVNYKNTGWSRATQGIWLGGYSGTWTRTFGATSYCSSASTGGVAYCRIVLVPGQTVTALTMDWARSVNTDSVKAELWYQPVDGASGATQSGSDVTFGGGGTARRLDTILDANISAANAFYLLVTNGTGTITVYGFMVGGTYTSIG